MKELVQLFHKHNVRFAVCGGFAVAHYGYVRATMDFDLLILPDVENANCILASLTEFGFGHAGLDETTFTRPGTAITLGAQPNQIDLLTSMSSMPTADILSRAQTVNIQGVPMEVVSLEDLLFAKKEAKRPKDRIDYQELVLLHPNEES